MRGLLAGVAVVGVVCAGCSGADGEMVEITTTDSAGRTTVVTQEVTEAPADPETPGDAAPTTATLVAVVLDVPGGRAIALDLPDSWRVEPLGEAVRTIPAEPDPEATPPQRWCLVPPSAPPAIDGCGGVLIAAGPDWLPGAAGAAYSPQQVDGWRFTPGPVSCPVGPDGQPTDAATVTSTPDDATATASPTPDDSEVDLLVSAAEGLPLTSVQTEVGGRQVLYETWRASCSLTEEVVLNPQVWHDRELQVLVKDVFGLPDTVIIVESLREV